MVECVHQLVANFVCLLFDAGQVAYRGVFRLFPVLQRNGTDEGGETEPKPKVAATKTKTMS